MGVRIADDPADIGSWVFGKRLFLAGGEIDAGQRRRIAPAAVEHEQRLGVAIERDHPGVGAILRRYLQPRLPFVAVCAKDLLAAIISWL